ncbi:multiple organellar RNA editing factor 8, chloroplastic/mitochondrial-like [Aristolochia californica]|uniref:multiple organellar RNA editing factor 8, chloroplastic/mitochondrial-like n=1 Tax=Aristolochia californica TaxID=171875 RepID=UPI0035E25B35
MAASLLGRALISKPTFTSLLSRSFTSTSLARVPPVHNRLRFLIAIKEYCQHPAGAGVRYFSARPTTSSLNDPSPNWSNRPPKETILLDGCDFEHWLVVMEPPDENATRDDIIDSYIKTLAQIIGSEDEARKKIYSVSTRCYFAFGCLVSEELSYKIKELPKVRWVLPDSYLDVKNKDYGGEPFIDGKAVPYDPKYHEEWIRNHARANERSRRNDRPRNFDRSRNFERRRENMQTRDMNTPPRPMPNRDAQTSPNLGTGTASYQNQGSVPTGGMPSPGYQNQGGVPNSGFQGQGQGGMPSGGYQNQGSVPTGGMPSPGYQNQGRVPNSGFQNQGYQSPGMGGVQNNPTYPNQPVGGMRPTNPGYQGVGGAPANPGYQNQGVGGVPPVQPGYQNQGTGGGWQNQGASGHPGGYSNQGPGNYQRQGMGGMQDTYEHGPAPPGDMRREIPGRDL